MEGINRFSDKTKEGTRLVLGGYDKGEIRRGVALLAESANAGDPEGLYFLGRCYMGPEWVWEYSGLPFEEERGISFIQESIRRGSACGVLGSMRHTEIGTPSVMAAMPFASLRQARDLVMEQALGGWEIAQYIIGNTYFWGDILTLEPERVDALNLQTNFQDRTDMLNSIIGECIPWYEKACGSGFSFLALNYHNLFAFGANGYPKDPARAEQIAKRLADRGCPVFQQQYGHALGRRKEHATALEYYKKAAEGGQISAWGNVGYAYSAGQGTAADEHAAVDAFERAAAAGDAYSQRALGWRYYFGTSEAVPQDYAKAAYYLTLSAQQGNEDAFPILGECYLRGRGVPQDAVAARSYFERVPNTHLGANGLGEIYCGGLGVPQDIAKGVGYLQKAVELGNSEAKVTLSGYKKTLFGKWVRR